MPRRKESTVSCMYCGEVVYISDAILITEEKIGETETGEDIMEPQYWCGECDETDDEGDTEE